MAFPLASRQLASEHDLRGAKHLHASGVGPLAAGKRAAVGAVRVSFPGLWATASALASHTPPLADRAVARLGTAASHALFLASRNAGLNPGQVVDGHRHALNVALCPSRGVAYVPGVVSPRPSTGRRATLRPLGPATTSHAARVLADGRRDAPRARRTMGCPATGPGVAGCFLVCPAPSSPQTVPDALR